MTDNLLQVKNLTASIGSNCEKINIIKNISFDIKRGETFVLLGESGSGKSLTSLCILGRRQKY